MLVMNDFYGDVAMVALDMIAQFGQRITLRNITPGAYDPSTGTQAPDIITEQPAVAMLVEYKGFEFQTGTLIQQGDKKLKVPALGLEWPPDMKTKAIIADKAWSVVNVKAINPAGVPILYELQVRT